MKLIILGNGFDLHHNLKTSFYDFRAFLKKSNDLKDQDLISKIDVLLKVDNEEKAHLLWNNFEAIIGVLMNADIYQTIRIKDVPQLLEEFTQKFYTYLLDVSKEEISKLNKKILKEFDDADVILTFNYTSTYLKYINNNSKVDIIHIHGNLEEDNLPIIGYYYENSITRPGSIDYTVKYGGRVFHKPALAQKQNEIDLDNRISNFVRKWRNKITEIVIIGYSFGLSDSHIYDILKDVMISQVSELNVPKSRAKDIKLIKFTIYNYDKNESESLIVKITNFLKRINKRLSINVTGNGFTHKEMDMITFELENY